MRILVTGVSGLLGINLAMESSKRHEVYGVFNTNPLVNPLFNCISADLLGKDVFAEVFEQIQPDWVIHCAALANLDDCEDDPAFAEVMNSELPGEVARVTYGRAGLIHISTDAVFDGSRGDYTEEDEPNPLSVYGRTKLAGEWAVMDANPDAIIARVNLFGWSSRGKRSLSEFFFYNMQAGKPVKGFTDVLFCPLLANDLVATLMQMVQQKLSGLYHVVGSKRVSKYDFGLAVARTCGLDEHLISPISVKDFGLKATRANNLILKNDKLAGILPNPIPDYSTGLGRFYELYQQGYPQVLRSMVDNSGKDLNPYRNGG
jgi:dTDP-4-dehydrorhamnose reductase